MSAPNGYKGSSESIGWIVGPAGRGRLATTLGGNTGIAGDAKGSGEDAGGTKPAGATNAGSFFPSSTRR